jgi:hypothetical protein
MLSRKEIEEIVARVEFDGFNFRVHEEVTFVNEAQEMTTGLYLQLHWRAPDNVTGEPDTYQSSRKWRLSPFMTRSEIVSTCFKAVMTAIEHEAREQFTYRGAAIYGPHFDVEALVDLATTGHEDVREVAA